MKSFLILTIKSIMLFFIGSFALMANHTHQSQWLTDPQFCLSTNAWQHIERHLIEVAKSSDVHVNVIVLNLPKVALADAVHDHLMLLQAKYPEKKLLPRQGYVVLNLGTQEAEIILGEQTKLSQEKLIQIERIRKQIILTAFNNDGFEQAIFEGTLALRIAFEEWPDQDTSADFFGLTYLQTSLLFILFLGIIFGLKITFWTRPAKAS